MPFTGQPTITSNYAGKVFGEYISAALKEAKSLEGLTVLENIKYKENIRKMAGASLVVDATCDFVDAGTLTMTEAVLEPKNLQINVDLCKGKLLSGWEAEEMKAGSFNRTAPTFDQYVLSYFGELIADSVEGSIWSGAAANAGEFEGFLTATTGAFAVNGNVVASAATAAYTAANIIENLQQLVADIPANVYGRDDLRIYMNMKTYRFYISAISTLGYVNAYNMNGDYVPVFEGITIQPCPGMPDNKMVAAETSNLFYGCDLVSEDTGASIKMLDMSNLDGSDNLRVVAKFSGGVQVGIGADVVSQA
jgi:hypothetical protein